MKDKFQNKYRIESTRLKHWDYGWNAYYFVTICTKDRMCFFGEVVEGEMVLNIMGKLAKDCWLEIPVHFSYASLGNYVIMPNHVHGIVIIDKRDDGRDGRNDERNVDRIVESRLIASLRTNNDFPGGITGNKNPMLHDNLPIIIRWFKGRTTFESRKIHTDFTWQPRYHDHIIRNDQSYQKISEYIMNNPLNWSSDQLR